MTNSFAKLYKRQVKYQAELDGRYSENELLKNDGLVLANIADSIEELIEARIECPSRKRWNPKKANLAMDEDARKRCALELVDTLHFIMNAFVYLGFSYSEIEELIEEKMAFNDGRADHQKFTSAHINIMEKPWR